METAQESLLLVLGALEVEPDIGTTSKRKSVQKAVYLAQAAGVDLGYRYNWYVMGPYSPALTRDYFALRDSLSADPPPKPTHHLARAAAERLGPLPTLFDVPEEAKSLGRAEWLELLASVHYLRQDERRSNEQVRARLQREKPHVAPYFSLAEESLKEAGLI